MESCVFVCTDGTVIGLIKMFGLYVPISIVFPAQCFMAYCAGIKGCLQHLYKKYS